MMEPEPERTLTREERDFENLIRDIHRLYLGPITELREDHTRDIRRLELLALFHAFLGDDYNPAKINAVGAVQIELRRYQSLLSVNYLEGKINAERYVDQVNRAQNIAFRQIEDILGKDDFRKLFGDSSDGDYSLIDKGEFMSSRTELGSDVTSSYPNIKTVRTRLSGADYMPRTGGRSSRRYSTHRYINNVRLIRERDLVISRRHLASVSGLSVKTIANIENGHQDHRQLTKNVLVDAINRIVNSSRRNRTYTYREVFPND